MSLHRLMEFSQYFTVRFSEEAQQVNQI